MYMGLVRWISDKEGKVYLSVQTFPGQIHKTNPDIYQGQISSKDLKTSRTILMCFGLWPVGKNAKL